VEQILKGGRHLLSLINEVLDIARIESGRLSLEIERLSANDVVQEAVLLVEPQAAKQKIQLYIEAGSAWRLHISADRQRFKQVVLNIVSNAVKYNREGGSVRISVEAREQYLRLSVADTGPGIPADKIGLLFSPFERLGAEHAGVEGSGIGLALSKRLVEAMAGRIGVHSEFGSGTTFWVEFPVADAVVFTDSWAREDLGRLHSGVNGVHRPVVLCIEDNDSNYRLIERTLAQRPEIKLICGALGETAVPLAELHTPDLILLDMHLPDLEGYDVLGRLRANAVTNGIPVVVVSADATTPQIERMLNAGAAAYLTKPLEIQKLLAVVDEALGKGAQNKVVCLET
jgi:CheY-like chemotaxis protein